MAGLVTSRPAPAQHRVVAAQRHAKALHERLAAAFGQQLAHARLLRSGQVEKPLQHRQHQRVPIGQRHRAQRTLLGRAAGQAEGQPHLAVQAQCRQPQVVGVGEHGQVFASVQLHGELGRQLMKALAGLQRFEDLPRQRPAVEQHGRVETGRRAEHQVAHIVARRLARAQAGVEQACHQPSVVGTDAANLQVAAVGYLDHAAGKALGGVGHCVCLGRAQGAGVELDA